MTATYTRTALPAHILAGEKADGTAVALQVTDDGKMKMDVSSVTVSNVEISNDVGNPIPTASGGAKATASISRVSASATSVTLLAANANRRRVIIYNESTAILRIKLGATASATSYSLLLGPGDTYESPTDWVYTGAVDGIWDAANGAAQITEV